MPADTPEQNPKRHSLPLARHPDDIYRTVAAIKADLAKIIAAPRYK